MRIECINAETDGYLPVLLISEEKKISGMKDFMEHNENTTSEIISECCSKVQNTVDETELLEKTVKEEINIAAEDANPDSENNNEIKNSDEIESENDQNFIAEGTRNTRTAINEKQEVGFNSEIDPVSHSSAINHHFEKNGFIVAEYSKPQTIAGLKNLTYQIGDNYTYTAPLLKELRKAICSPDANGDRNICFKFDKCANGFYHQFANALKQYGLFTKYFINGNVLTATISHVPRIISYINGQWLEMYSSYILEEVVSEYAKTNGYEYEILMNVRVTNINSVHIYAHEIDCVISIDDKCFAFEVKSGHFDDYSTLYNTRNELCFVPDRYLLLSTALEENVAETLGYFYEFYITGMNGFKNRIIEMIDKAFAN